MAGPEDVNDEKDVNVDEVVTKRSIHETDKDDAKTREATKGAKVAIIGAGIAGVAAVLAAVATVVLPKVLDDPPPRVTFDEAVPRGNHEGVSMRDGFIGRGSATNLPTGDSVWLMDKLEYGYAIAEEARMSGDRWEAASYPVGVDPTLIPFTFRAVAIWADPSCANGLREAVDRGEWLLVSLPDGCREAAIRDVTVTEE